MNKGFIAFVSGLVVSFLFGVAFMHFQKVEVPKELTMYYLQTGVYQTHENALNMQTTLTSLELEAYIYQKEGHYYVITGISSDKEDVTKVENQLKANSLNYVIKEKVIDYEKNEDKQIEMVLEALTT